MRTRYMMLAVTGLVLGAVFAFAALRGLHQSEVPKAAATVTGKALIGGPFTLTDQSGKRVTDKDFVGHYTLVFFGFTHCPDICPTALQVVSAALDKLGDAGKDIVPVFISLDPERDTPAVLAEYIKSFNPRYVGLTGSKEEVAAAAKAYRVFFEVVPDEKNAADYTIDHAAIIYLMGKDGQFVTHIPHTTDVDQVVQIIRKSI